MENMEDLYPLLGIIAGFIIGSVIALLYMDTNRKALKEAQEANGRAAIIDALTSLHAEVKILRIATGLDDVEEGKGKH